MTITHVHLLPEVSTTMMTTVICFYFVCINSRQEKFTLKYIRTRAMCSIVTRTNKIFGLNNFRTRGLYENFSITKNKQITVLCFPRTTMIWNTSYDTFISFIWSYCVLLVVFALTFVLLIADDIGLSRVNFSYSQCGIAVQGKSQGCVVW